MGCIPFWSPRSRGAGIASGREEVAANLWFSDWERGGVLLEEARYLARWDQTLTLLRFESEEVPPDWRGRWTYPQASESAPRDPAPTRQPGGRYHPAGSKSRCPLVVHPTPPSAVERFEEHTSELQS